MASSGADAFLIAADFTKTTGERHWEALLRTRAIENGCYVLAANQQNILEHRMCGADIPQVDSIVPDLSATVWFIPG